jgi:hypothetical protein
MSLIPSTVPAQWKQAVIKLIPKIPSLQQLADCRPISITPILTRVMERMVVANFIYPSLLSPPPTLTFYAQFAFRPTGSTTAAIITILDHVTRLLATNPFVAVIALDFSKAFDTVRHATLAEKLAQMDLPDDVYNWLCNFLSGRTHSTEYKGGRSNHLGITASIIQGSALGPTAFVVNAGDLTAITPGNEICKYADDTHLIIPVVRTIITVMITCLSFHSGFFVYFKFYCVVLLVLNF